MKRLAAIAAGAALIFCLAMPAGAGASRPPFKLVVSFRTDGAHGYRVSFGALDGRGKPDQAQVSFYKDREQVSYGIKGGSIVDGDQIDADFGPIGSIQGTFDRDIETDGKCEPIVHIDSAFDGKVDVTGEHGFSTLKTDHLDGEVTALLKDPDCAEPQPTPRPHLRPRISTRRTQLVTCPNDDQGAGRVTYIAQLNSRREKAFHTINVFDKIGKVNVFRGVFLTTNTSTITISKEDKSIALKPGGAYSGSAVFDDGKLTGDLSVDLLGLQHPLELTPGHGRLAKGGAFPKCGPSPG